MSVPRGLVAYELGESPCTGCGIKWTANELDDVLVSAVVAVLHDEPGSSFLQEILAPLGESEFAVSRVRHAVAQLPTKTWRVGEAIAEVYLTDWRDCLFPWPISRDARRPGVSLPGADLVGFATDEHGDCLALGEVKTSSQADYPPSVMYGLSGLRQQLQDLRDRADIQHSLIRYLGVRCQYGLLRQRFVRAMQRYLADSSDVHLYGVLIRDVHPNDRDLRAAVCRLAVSCSASMRIELLAIYLPKCRIDRLTQDLMKVVNGGEA